MTGGGGYGDYRLCRRQQWQHVLRHLVVEETVQVRRADICRRRYTPTAKQLIEGPP